MPSSHNNGATAKPPATKKLAEYIEFAGKYLDAAAELAGKPQKLAVVGDHLYWTQGRKQALFKVSTKDATATGEHVIVTEEEKAERDRIAATHLSVARRGSAVRKTVNGVPVAAATAATHEAKTPSPHSPPSSSPVAANENDGNSAAATATTATNTTNDDKTKASSGAAAAAAESEKALTKEEELLRERMRSLVTGISSFRVRPADGAVFFFSGLDMFVYHQQGPLANKGPFRVFDFLSAADKKHFEETGGKPNMHIQFVTPADGEDSGPDASKPTRITFVNNNNVYAADITEDVSNASAPLSLVVTPITTIGDDLHQCGLADYITQEEFNRYTGHYAKGKYIVFSYTDMAMMRHLALLKGGDASLAADGSSDGTEKMAYSRVGDPNARTAVIVHDTESRVFHFVPPAALEKAAAAASAAFTNVEYIPRFGFKGDSHVYLSLLSRTQEEMAVVSCSIEDLPEIAEADIKNLYSNDNEAGVVKGADAAVGSMLVEWSQRIEWAWVDVMPGEPIHFGKIYDITVCAAAETRRAHYHIYYRVSGSNDPTAWRPLTRGNWSVKPGTVRLLEESNTVAFIGNVDGRLKNTLFSVTLPSAAFAEAAAAAVTDEYYLMRHSGLSEHVYSCYSFDEKSVYFVSSNRLRPAELVCAALERRQEIRTIPAEPWLKPREDAAAAASSSSSTTTSSNNKSSNDEKHGSRAGSVEPGESSAADCARSIAIDAAAFTLSSDRASFSLFGCNMVLPTLITVNNRRGVPLSAHLFRGVDQKKNNSDGGDDEEEARPLVLYVYGGPHVQLITESDFDCNCRATVQALVNQGINVAIVDNQQAHCNCLRDLSICKKNMGRFETEDYTDVVDFLAGKTAASPSSPADADAAAAAAAAASTDATPTKEQPTAATTTASAVNSPSHRAAKPKPDAITTSLPAGWKVDPARVAIFGWSYGGYATLLAMSQAADVFKLGFAGAPVGDWKLYDTGYTERYMGLLLKEEGKDADAAEDGTTTDSKKKEIAEPYMNSTIASFVDGFPDELNRVFIAHGLLDENVHFQHTAHVVEAMVGAGKPYNMLVYPGERHGLRQKRQSRLHHEGMLLKTMVELL